MKTGTAFASQTTLSRRRRKPIGDSFARLDCLRTGAWLLSSPRSQRPRSQGSERTRRTRARRWKGQPMHRDASSRSRGDCSGRADRCPRRRHLQPSCHRRRLAPAGGRQRARGCCNHREHCCESCETLRVLASARAAARSRRCGYCTRSTLTGAASALPSGPILLILVRAMAA